MLRRYGSSSSADKLRSTASQPPWCPELLSPKPSFSSSQVTIQLPYHGNSRKGTTSPLLLLRWSFRDKKRVEAIVQNFRDMNGRIHDKIKLWCLASQLGVDLQHLRHLQNDKNSKLLGFDIDATLRLTAWDAEALPGTLELQDRSWQDMLPHETMLNDRFSTSEMSGRTLLLERFPYDIDDGFRTWSTVDLTPNEYSIDSRSRSRVDALAKLLHQPKELVFRVPRCIGWKYVKAQKSIAFVFDIERRLKNDPIDLLSLLSDTTVKPSLGEKFRLAHGLANCISQLHMVQWVL